MSASFRLYRLAGARLSPEAFGGREPSLDDVVEEVRRGELKIEALDKVSVKVSGETLWLSKEAFDKASCLLGRGSYEAHEGATLTASKGAWTIVEGPDLAPPPIGAPKGARYVRVQTRLGQDLGLDPFVVEEAFVFRGFKGEDVEVGRIANARYFLLAYRRTGVPLTRSELERTQLWRNYLSRAEVWGAIKGASRFGKREFWHVERMGPEALANYKVVWRDVADSFVPAVAVGGVIPDYTVNYVTVSSEDEAYYLMAVLLAPQINAVVSELVPWIGHVQPRFMRYFKIPRYEPASQAHRRLAEIGREVASRGLTSARLSEIEQLVGRCSR